jgi:serine/threonine protein kinase/tetratricopeptide (TPR) repeat protein
MQNSQCVLDRYQLGDLLGRGGMGAVYQGTDLKTGKKVAVKVLEPETIADDPQAINRFNGEAQALRELDHPNIVRVLASTDQKDVHYLVMDFVPGGSLDSLLKRMGAIHFSRTLEIGLDLADALTRTHRLGIVHRDIKPANILLENDGTARLSDFGIAQMTKSPGIRESTNSIAGTLHYLSPEALRGQDSGPRSDIWAFGVVLYEMLTGNIPFDGDEPIELINAITTQPVPDLEAQLLDTPAGLFDLVYRMLEKDPERRIPSVRLVGAELETIFQGGESLLGKQPRSRFTAHLPSQEELLVHNLPAQVTPFVGRENELNRLSGLISDPNTRLVTICSRGGMGKTRLAIKTAQTKISEFEDGVYFVSLAPLNLVEDIVPALADAVGFKFHGSHDPKRQLLTHLRDKQTLLVMDNFEHILEGAELINDMLRAAPGVKVLATSREKLNIHGETLFSIDGLQVPTASKQQVEMLDFSAGQLFVQEAQRLQPDLELESEDLDTVIDICQLVDGMPLGIILAAAWVELLSPQEIASQIKKNLDFLETDQRGIPDRQRSMRAIFDYSWIQLSESEQQVFSRLSIFRGGFTRHAAQSVTSATIKQLVVLVNKSLVGRDSSSGRFNMHGLLRQYAFEKLTESGGTESMRAAHCKYFSEFLGDSLEIIRGLSQFETLLKIRVEFENVKQAWSWGVQSRNYDAIKYSAETLYVFCEWLNRYSEGEALFQKARVGFAPLENEQPPSAWVRVLLPWFDLRVEGRGRLDEFETITSQAETALAAALELDDKTGMAYAYVLLGAITEWTGTAEKSISYYEKGLACYADIGDSFWVLIRLGLCYRKIGDHAKSSNSFERSLARGRETGDRIKIAWSQFNLGESKFVYRDQLNDQLIGEVQHRWREANTLFQQVGSPGGQIWTCADLMLISFLKDDFTTVKNLAEQILSIAAEIEYKYYGVDEASGMLANVAFLEGDFLAAKKYFHEWLSTKPKMGKAMRSYAAICKPSILLMIIPCVANLLVYDGDYDRAVKLLAAAFSHPACACDLLDRWPGLTELRKDLQIKLGLEEFKAFWTRGQEQGIDVMLDKLYNTYIRNKM